MKILVTGASGYIGSTLVPMLLDAGHAVRAVDRFFFGNEHLPERPGLQKIREDSRRLTERHLEGVEAVIDLVAISNDPSGDLFPDATLEINWASRVHTAKLAKRMGARRYILPSSCSIYGYQGPDFVADESAKPNPLTTYARANAQAEVDVLALADGDFTVVALRQATVYGLSPRMRFDLAINGMACGAWQKGELPLMRDGSQWRPMVHVRDTSRAQIMMLDAPAAAVNGQIFNVGSAANVYRIGELGERVAAAVPRTVKINWYGDADTRSYRVNFDKIEALGFRAEFRAEDGVHEICRALKAGQVAHTPRTITLDWYRRLSAWHARLTNGAADASGADAELAADPAEMRRWVEAVELHGGILNIQPNGAGG
ncbi:MAG: NAD(P)-dependent oxidoreductase [Deltaproteobacteria bacterium]|nr:NAD(P)-dependent oxidoreductase [Deltaproteobacteria bacterium]